MTIWKRSVTKKSDFIDGLYLLLELVKRTIAKGNIAFSNLSEKIRFCLYHYLTLGYVCNEVKEGVRRIKLKKQKEIAFEKDLFSG
ncbi:MAG: hypothetical protein CSA95_05810 [Bacteroidetes bacterium]|nr:MAG: hypothetical protein CSA95_05810 [Bacteroidota bacterium]